MNGNSDNMSSSVYSATFHFVALLSVMWSETLFLWQVRCQTNLSYRYVLSLAFMFVLRLVSDVNYIIIK